jgi:NADH:ubiquinone oxidoreductase subunit E
MISEAVMPIIEKYRDHRGGLISILEEIQRKYGYLPQEVLRVVADETGRALVDIYGVATFYKAFRLQPRGKHLACVCLGTACHVRGAPAVAKEFEKLLDVRTGGGTTADREFTLETVRCLGACALGPIVVVDGHYFANTATSQVSDILRRTRAGLDAAVSRDDKRVFPLEVACPHCNHTLMDASRLIDGVPSIHLTVSYGDEHGWLLLSSLYGSYTIASGDEVPVGSVVNFFCPHCHAELIGAWNCTVCDAPMVPMIVRGGGIVQICSRRGCRSHMLDLEGATL